MKLRTVLSLVLIAIFSASPAMAQRGAIAKFGYIEQFRQTMDRLMQADNEMYSQMIMVARKLEDFYLSNGHLPEPGSEQDKFKESVGKLLGANPYHPKTTELYYGMNMEDDSRVKLYFLNDSTLTTDRLKECRVKAPDGWTADPGSIMVMVNNETLYAIWATSADRRPLRNYQKNDVTRLIYHDCAVRFAHRNGTY